MCKIDIEKGRKRTKTKTREGSYQRFNEHNWTVTKEFSKRWTTSGPSWICTSNGVTTSDRRARVSGWGMSEESRTRDEVSGSLKVHGGSRLPYSSPSLTFLSQNYYHMKKNAQKSINTPHTSSLKKRLFSTKNYFPKDFSLRNQILPLSRKNMGNGYSTKIKIKLVK